MQREAPYAAARRDPLDEVGERLVVVLVVDLGGTRFVTRDADTALDGDRHLTVGAIRHGRAAIAHEVWLAHKRRAEAASASDALGRAANIQVDGSVTPRTGDHHGLPQHVRVGATELQHNGLRVVSAIVRKEARELGFAAVHDRIGGHHLRVQRGPSAEQAQHVPKETIRVVPETETWNCIEPDRQHGDQLGQVVREAEHTSSARQQMGHRRRLAAHTQ